MLKTVSIACLGLFTALSVQAAVINVPGDQPTIQAGVNAASDGDTVLIAADTYNLSAPVTINGKAITLRGNGGALATVLDGGSTNTLLVVQNVGGAGVTIDALGFADGQATETFHGGCAVFQNSTGTVVNSRFEGCETDSGDSSNSGGAIKISAGSDVSVQNSTFINNRSYSQGGAVHFFEATGEVTDSIFQGNIVSGLPVSGGGGVKATQSTGGPVLIQGNLFENNEASFAGGAISGFASDVSIIENEIVSNGNGRFGGGIHLETLVDEGGDREFQIIDNHIEDNFVLDVAIAGISPAFDKVSGGGVHLNFGVGGDTTASTVEIRGNVIRNNSAIDSRCTDGASSSGCGYGGGIVFFNALQAEQVVADNVIEGNVADVYAAANFDKVWLEFEGNRVEGNEAKFTHPGVGCVGNSSSNSTLCAINANRFIDNRFSADASPTTALNNAGALNVRRNDVVLTNNIFWNNEGQFAAAFIRHEDVAGQFSRIAFNTFVDNDQLSSGFGSLYLRGQGEVLNNVFVGDVRAIRADDFTSSASSSIAGNNITETNSAVARVEGVNYANVGSLNGETFASNNTALGPGFVDRFGGKFCLADGSALIDQVACLGSVPQDIIGTSRPTGAQCDVGAFEWFFDDILFHDRFQSAITAEC